MLSPEGFLWELYRDAHQGFVQVMLYRDEGALGKREAKQFKYRALPFQDARDLDVSRLATWQSAGYHAYFRVGVMDAQPEQGLRGGASMTSALTALWVDVDATDHDSRTRGRALRAQYRTLLGATAHPPSMVVFSGGGWHLYWLLDEPLYLVDEVTRALVERTMQGLCSLTGGDTSKCSLASNLRLPGTWNMKYLLRKNRARKKVVVVDFMPGRYEYRKLEDEYAPLAAPAPLQIKRAMPLVHSGVVPDWLQRLIDMGADEGNRNVQANKVAWALTQHVNEGEALMLLEQFNASCRPPMDQREVEGVVKSAYRNARAAPHLSYLHRYVARKDAKGLAGD